MSNPTAVTRPSFFKPLINNYSTELRLPIGFVRKHRTILPENAKLRIRSGKIWNVKIEETDDDEECFFTEGWSDFAEDLELQRMQMLVFWLNAGDGTFDVAVYDSDSNEREFSAVDFRGSSSHVVVVESDSEGESDESRPRFQFILTESRRSRMVLRKKFATAAGLIDKTSVVLQYLGRERYWAVVLQQRMPPNTSLDLAVGWNDFRVENKLVFGRIYSFEFNFAKNLILVSDCSSISESTYLHPNLNATVENCECLSIDHVWRYVKKLKQHHISVSRMDMPKPFATGIGIATTNGGNINLEDSQGTKWPVTVTDRNNGVFSMTGGLRDFLRSKNHVQVGDILLFESVPNSVANVVKVVVMEKEAGKEMLARSGKGGIIMS